MNVCVVDRAAHRAQHKEWQNLRHDPPRRPGAAVAESLRLLHLRTPRLLPQRCRVPETP